MPFEYGIIVKKKINKALVSLIGADIDDNKRDAMIVIWIFILYE